MSAEEGAWSAAPEGSQGRSAGPSNDSGDSTPARPRGALVSPRAVKL